MLRKLKFLITMILALIGILLAPYTAFSQEKVNENINAENFATMITNVNAVIADFGDKLKRTEIGDISEVSVSEPLKDITLDQYFKYGSKTTKGTVLYMEKDKKDKFKLVSMKTTGSKPYYFKSKVETKIKEYLLDEFNNFYKELLPVLEDIGKKLKKSPIRLDSVSFEIGLFGIVEGSVTIGINYESPTFGQEK